MFFSRGGIKFFRRGERGVSLVEVLIGIVIVTIASMATLSYFSYARGNIGKQGNRRAALERARERLEQLTQAGATSIGGANPADASVYWLTCSGTPCVWTRSSIRTTQTVLVDDLPAQPIETTVQWVNDPSAGTTTNDVLELGVKVWFTKNFNTDNGFDRVYIRTLRAS